MFCAHDHQRDFSAVAYTHDRVYRIDLEPNCGDQLFKAGHNCGGGSCRDPHRVSLLFHAMVWPFLLDVCAIIGASRAPGRVLLRFDFSSHARNIVGTVAGSSILKAFSHFIFRQTDNEQRK